MNPRLTKIGHVNILLVLAFGLFISACDKDEGSVFEYAEAGFYGDNILSKDRTEYSKRQNSLNCQIPRDKKLKIVITGKSVAPSTGVIAYTGIWFYDPTTTNNYVVTTFDESDYSQSFSSIDGGLTCDVKMQFDNGTFQIDYYENDFLTPTATKIIYVNY